jgi:hypothetical protein
VSGRSSPRAFPTSVDDRARGFASASGVGALRHAARASRPGSGSPAAPRAPVSAEIVHLSGIVLLVGAAAAWDLRLLGFSRGLPVTAMARHLLPWSRVGFAVVLPTGLMMFVAHAGEMAANPAFRLKLVLIAAALLNVALFHRGIVGPWPDWNVETRAPAAARLAALASLLLWAGVIARGRLLAYF